MNALDALPAVDLTRVDAHHGLVTSAALASLGRVRGYGTWKYSRLSRRLTDAKVRRALGRLDVDAVLSVADIETIADVPTFLFQDANFSVIQQQSDLLVEHAPALIKFPAGRLDELFTETALAAIHECSGGICRSVNKLAMLSLIEAADRRAVTIDETLVRDAARRM